MRRFVRGFLVVTVLALSVVVAPAPAAAASITVGNGCTLADAITAANTDTATGGCAAGSGDDTIVLEAGATYTLTAVADINGFLGPSGLPAITTTMTIQGNGATIQRDPTAPAFRLIRLDTGSLTITNLTLTGGVASDSNTPGGTWGGCAIATSTEPLRVVDSTITNCGALAYGSAIAGDQLEISGSTVYGNHTSAQVIVSGVVSGVPNLATITNTTITNNDGIGIFSTGNVGQPAPMSLNGVSITNNTTAGVQAYFNGHVEYRNSIVIPAPVALDGASTVTDLGGNITSGDPLLGPLQNNGGPTMTRLPLAGSPAIDGGIAAICAAVDQRGTTRPQGVGCDIGAVEVVATPPVLSLPDDLTLEATGPGGAVATFSATAVDYAGDAAGVVCTPPSGSTFTLGTAPVNCSATDIVNQTTLGSFNVTVQDTTGPLLTVPSNMTVPANNPAGATVSFAATANDAVDGTLTPTCTPPSGSIFAPGTTTVTCTVSDLAGNPASASFTITVTSGADLLAQLRADTITYVTNPTTERALVATLDKVRLAMQQDNPFSAYFAILQYIVQLDRAVDTRAISGANAMTLIARARVVLDAMM
jgi:hypothetical protein